MGESVKLRVCYLLPRLLPHASGTVVGGCAVNCISLASALREEGIHVELLTTVSDENLKHLKGGPLSDFVRSLPEASGGMVGKGLGALRVLRRGLKEMLREKHFDVVHSHSGTYPYAILPLNADGKLSVRLHSLYCPLGAKGGVFSKWWEQRAVARMILQRLDRIVAVTDNVRQSIEDSGVQLEMIESVPMCVDTRRFYPRNGREQTRYFSSDNRAARLLFVGNASVEKGFAGLLHTVRMLIDKGIDLTLVAAIENQSRIREYTVGQNLAHRLIRELGIGKHVHLLGVVDRIEDLYAESDIVVIPWKTSRGPSDYPLVALEAMSMGKCVVSTPVGGCPELLADGAGVLSEGYSDEQVASAIEHVIARPDLQCATGKEAIKKAQALSVHRSASQLIALYERLLEEKTHSNATCQV